MAIILLKSLLALAAIAALLYLCLKFIQKYTKFGVNSSTGDLKAHGISINSIAYIDASNKLLNFKCGKKNYLILVGKNQNLVIDSYEDKQN